MKFSAYAYTNRGGRDSNEDSIRCQIQGQRGAFLVADGLGGHQSGEVASALAGDVILASCTGGGGPARGRTLKQDPSPGPPRRGKFPPGGVPVRL